MGTRYLYIIRHGEYINLAGVGHLYPSEWDKWQESTLVADGGLTEKGVEQAKLTAKRMNSYPIDKIYSSFLPRAFETAEYIAQCFPGKELSVNKVAELMECNPWTSKETSELYGDDISIENINIHRKHADDTFEKFFKPNTGNKDIHEVLVCHGDLMRYLITKVIETKTDYWIKLKVYNCGINVVEIKENGNMFLRSLNDHGHLSFDLVT